jgi:uracil-DNA glycosylase family 4
MNLAINLAYIAVKLGMLVYFYFIQTSTFVAQSVMMMKMKVRIPLMNKHPLADCDNCPLKEKGNYVNDSVLLDGDGIHFSYSDSMDSIDLLVVGEAPGPQEISQGMAFVGPSGQLLRTLLERTGNTTGHIRFSNAVACHRSFGPGMAPEPPSKAAIQACRPRVLDLGRRAKTVLVLGNTAKEGYLQTTEKISSVRKGMPKSPADYPKLNGTVPNDQRIVSTFHPAAALRSADYYPSIVRDIQKLNKEAPNWVDPEYISFDNTTDQEDRRALFYYLALVANHCEWISVDIETASEKDRDFTHPKEWLSIAIGFESEEIDCDVIVIGGDALKDEDVLDTLEELLTEKRTIYHNAKFDVQVLMRLGVIDRPNIGFDTMLAHYVLDERPGYHGLKELSEELLGAPDYSAVIKPYIKKSKGNFGAIPKPILYKYNAFDAYCTYLLWKLWYPKLGKTRQMARLIEQSQELIRIELDGITIDLDYLDSLDSEVTEHIQEAEEALSNYYPIPINPKTGKEKPINVNSVPQTKVAIKALGIKGMLSTDKASVSKALERAEFNTREWEFLVQLAAHRKIKKLHGTYIRGTRKRMIDGRIYPTFLQHGTVFGRLSSRNPNVQNIPRGPKIKNLYVPGPGNVFVQCDYSQVELRVIACEAQDKYLQGVFMDPSRDIHGEVSDRLYGQGNWTKEDRVRAKEYVFGSIYGLEPYSISQRFGISEDQATKEQNQFFELIPDVMAWRQEVMARAVRDRKLTTDFGRIRRFPLITKSNKKDIGKESLAFLPQSTANDICLEAMVNLQHNFREVYAVAVLPKVRILVHDSILVECAEEYQSDVIDLMACTMVETPTKVYSTYVPFTVSVEVGTSWGNLQEVS